MALYQKRNFIIVALVLIIYAVGAVGTVLQASRSWIVPLTPFSLLLTGALLIVFHRPPLAPMLLFSSCIVVCGLLVEVVGIHTGFPFGDYQYGDTLGWKVAGVPAIIGLNWLMLTYCFGIITSRLNAPAWIRCTVAALGMTGMDVLMEPVAMYLDYWHWDSMNIPVQNYLSWFVISLAFQVGFCRLLDKPTNTIASTVLTAQFMFFLILFIFIKI